MMTDNKWRVVVREGAMRSDWRTLKSFPTLAATEEFLDAQIADPKTEWEKGMLGIMGIAAEKRDHEDTIEQVMTDMLTRDAEVSLG